MSIKYLYLLISISLVSINTNIQAQDNPSKQPKWELGVNMLSLFKGNHSLPQKTYGLIIKRQLAKENALRFRQDFYFNSSIKPLIKGSNQPASYFLSFDFGYEKRNGYGKFIHYFGSDLVVRHEITDLTTGAGINGNTPTYSRLRGKAQTYGLAFFTGGKYMATNRISVSIETYLNLLYERTSNSNGEVDLNNQFIREPITSKTHGIYASVLPMPVIYLSYFF
jgi:hypothetical protein